MARRTVVPLKLDREPRFKGLGSKDMVQRNGTESVVGAVRQAGQIRRANGLRKTSQYDPNAPRCSSENTCA
jgi:hypothetical protein